MKPVQFGPLFLALIVAPLGMAQVPNCIPSQAAKTTPRLPFQVTFEKQVTKANYVTHLLQVPNDRFAVIESIALKGSQSANTYLAIELETALGLGYPDPIAAVTPASQVAPAFKVSPLPGYARHFLYGNQTSVAVPVHIREETKILAGAGTHIVLGIQTSAPTIEPFSITLTGTYIERCSLAP